MSEPPVFSECVIGYRSWVLADWVLAPVARGNPWRPGVNRATCRMAEGGFFTLGTEGDPPPKHSVAPHQKCSCGLHGYHDIPNETFLSVDPIVVGAIAAWGNLQVHHNGFRAEYAQILALVEGDGLDDVSRLYGVPLVPRDLLAAEAQRHGSPLPESLRPPPPRPADVWGWTLYAGLGVSHFTRFSVAFDVADDPEDSTKPPRKKPANRQGPPRPRRAPKKLGP